MNALALPITPPLLGHPLGVVLAGVRDQSKGEEEEKE